MNFFNNKGNFQFYGMDDFLNQINQKCNNKDDIDLNDIDAPELKQIMRKEKKIE